MKHKMKFLVLVCITLVGLTSFVAIAENLSEIGVTEKSKMKEVHVKVEGHMDCFKGAAPFESSFKHSNLIFTGVVTERTNRDHVTKQILPKRDLIRFTHHTILGSVFKVNEILKAPKGFEDKTIHVENLYGSEIGEEMLIYANIDNENEFSRISSKGCTRSKPVKQQRIEYWKGKKNKEIEQSNALFFYGSLKGFFPERNNTKRGPSSSKNFRAQFQVKEVFENSTEWSDHEIKHITVSAGFCSRKPEVGQNYVWRANVKGKKLGSISEENSTTDIYSSMQFDATCGEKIVMIDEVDAVRRLVKEEQMNGVEAWFMDAEDDMLPVNPIFRDKALKDRVIDETGMREVHGTLDPVQTRCKMEAPTLTERPSFEKLFERADIVFTGVFIDRATEDRVIKRVREDINLIEYTHIPVSKSTFKVTEILKAPPNYNDKIIYVDMSSPGKLGEEFIIYASISHRDNTTYISSSHCSGNININEWDVQKIREIIGTQ